MGNAEHAQEKYLIDAPIRSSAEDELGRAPLAKDFAASIRELDASQGLVVGILGPWGHGKSSFINLMREQFKIDPPLTVVDFNPWMFSSSNQLVNFFFTEIGAELKVRDTSRFGTVADWLAKYAGILKPAAQFIPIPGATFAGEMAAATLSGVAETTNADRSANKVREEIAKELAKLQEPIVVVIDDIDRLTTPEIRDIFKLVRLTARFPNVIYLVAFDRVRVEQALSEDGLPGRAYLEKIIQLSFDVPQAPRRLLRSQVFKELDRILAPMVSVPLDQSRWAEVYYDVIDPLLSNMRDVTRYAISARPTIESLGGQVDLVDLLAMEALRVFRPELFRRLSQLRDVLTGARSASYREEAAKQKTDDLLTKFSDDDKLIRSLIRNVFPGALQYIENSFYGSDSESAWRTTYRMADVDFFDLYIERFISDELAAFRNSERAFGFMRDGATLKEYLTGLEPEGLENVIEGITWFEKKFTTDMIVPASVTLLNLIDSVPERKHRGFFDFGGSDASVRRVVVQLLRSVEDEAERERLISKILGGVETYSSRLLLILVVRHHEGMGYKLVNEAFAEQIHKDFVSLLQEISPPEPSREWDAWRIYAAVQEETGEAPLKPDDDPDLLRSVLHSLKSTAPSQSGLSPQVHYEDRLGWDDLVKLFGSEDAVKAVVRSVRKALGDDNVLQLAEKYLSGWRPKRF